jgi:hypothetical protein
MCLETGIFTCETCVPYESCGFFWFLYDEIYHPYLQHEPAVQLEPMLPLSVEQTVLVDEYPINPLLWELKWYRVEMLGLVRAYIRSSDAEEYVVQASRLH